MKINDLTDLRASGIEIGSLRTYLRINGWTRTRYPSDKLLMFEKAIPEMDEPVQLALPSDFRFRDAVSMVGQAIETISILDDVAEDDVVLGILRVSRDIIEVKLPDGLDVSIDSIPLEMAFQVLETHRNLLTDAAAVEQRPSAHLPKPGKAGREYTKQCRFAHTKPGSFRFIIESPLPPPPEESEQFELPGVDAKPSIPPFSRRVVERFVRGLAISQKAVSTNDIDSLVSGYAVGFNANMFDCYDTFWRANKGGVLEYQVAWSPQWEISKDIEQVGSDLSVDPKWQPFMERASQRLKKIQLEAKHLTLLGTVVELRSEEPPIWQPDVSEIRMIVLKTDVPGLGTQRVRVTLPLMEYLDAVDAHRSGRRVRVDGVLERVGRYWHLLEPMNFQALL